MEARLDPYGNNQTGASHVGQDQATAMRIRAAKQNELERAKTLAANGGTNSLARPSAWAPPSAGEGAGQTTPRLAAFTAPTARPAGQINPFNPGGIPSPFDPRVSNAKTPEEAGAIYRATHGGLPLNEMGKLPPEVLSGGGGSQPGDAPTQTRPAGMVPYNSGTVLSPTQGNALLGQDTSNLSDGGAHDAGLAAAGKNQLTMTPYGQISSRNGQPGDTQTQGPSYVANNGVSNPGVVPAFDQQAAHAALYANPAMRGIFTANTPENAAFVAHANQNGLQSAYQNAGSIVQGARQQPASQSQATQQAPTPQGTAGAIAGALAPVTASTAKLNAYGPTPPRPVSPPTPTANSNLGFMIGG